MQVWVVGMNLLIVLAYVVIGILLVRKFDAAAPTWALSIFRVTGLTFFLTCAMTHGHMALHAFEGTANDPYSLHYTLIHLPQALAGVVSAVLGWSFISLRIYDRSYYGSLLDREIDRQAREIASRIRASDIDTLAGEARRVADAALLIRNTVRPGPG